MKAAILCTDYGGRAFSLTANKPKALLPVRGRPIIEFIVRKVQLLEEVDKIFIVTNHRFYSEFKKWQENFFSKKPIDLIDTNTDGLGNNSGVIKWLVFLIEKGKIDDDLIVIDGNNLFDFDLSAFIKFAKGEYSKNVVGVYNLNGKFKSNRFDIVKLDDKKRIVDFLKNSPRGNSLKFVSTCICFFPKEKLFLFKEYINKRGEAEKIDSYLEWLIKKDEVFGFEFHGNWINVRDLDSYTEAIFIF